MKPDHRVLLCCVVAWLSCCAIVQCNQGWLFGNGNVLKDGKGSENDGLEYDAKTARTDRYFADEDDVEEKKKKKCKDVCGFKDEVFEEEKVKCLHESDPIQCECKPEEEKIIGFDYTNHVCKDCECGDSATGCSFKDGVKTCDCPKRFVEHEGICKDCECGVNATGCSFEDDGKTCVCPDRFVQYEEKCKETCEDENGCKNGATCDEKDTHKFCECISGTSGDLCDIVDDCSEGLKDCKGNQGRCWFNVTNRAAECECPDKKEFNKEVGFCEVPEESCNHAKSKCIGTKGKCDVNEKNEIICDCPPKKEYLDDKGCTVPEESCNQTKSKCIGTKGKCDVNEKNEIFCNCPPKKEYLDDKGCIVTDETCNKDKSNCIATNGSCDVNEKNETFCECPPKTRYVADKGCTETCEDVNECKNGATCVDEETGKICECIPGTSGDLCDIVDDCSDGLKECKGNQGECWFNVEIGAAQCDCPDKKAFNQEVGFCEDCYCGINSKNCTFENGEKTCHCEEGYADKGGTCEICDCGANSTGCRFEGEKKICDCTDGFTPTSRKCIDERCEHCGDDEGVLCNINETGAYCLCKEGEEKEFDSEAKLCRKTCANETVCKHGAECVQVDEEKENKFCRCPDKTSGDTCADVDDCNGIYKKCVNESGHCWYNVEKSEAECKCSGKKKLMDKSKYCADCDCGTNSITCSFINDKKTCICKANYSEDSGTCKDCYCGINSKNCTFVKGKQTCQCEEGYADKSGTCETCYCGEKTKNCSFINNEPKCICEEGFDVKNGKCKECDCGEHAKSCRFQNNEKICQCKETFKDNGGICEECDCGKNSTNCEFKDGKRKCTCKSGSAQDGDTCKVCKCEDKNTDPCRFEDGEMKCDCKANYAKKDGKCTPCNCGANSKGCTFEGEDTICKCEKGFGSKDKKCKADNCYKKCGVVHEEGHDDVECEGDRFGAMKDIKCDCKDGSLKFDDALRECRQPCSEKADCQHNGECKGESDLKFCSCLKGTNGSNCEYVKECLSDGKYAKCSGEKGNCIFDLKTKAADCQCVKGKKLDKKAGYCQDECKTDKDCGTDKICSQGKYCTCEEGRSGENCEIINGCTEELKKNCVDAGAKCVFDKNEVGKATCGCDSEDIVYEKEKNTCTSKFCKDIGCQGSATCEFDANTKTGHCECPNGKYYDYNNNFCTEPDKCLLRKTLCKENEKCEKGECKCKYGKQGEECLNEKFCITNRCFKTSECKEESASCECKDGTFFTGLQCKDSKCILNISGEGCSCPTNMIKDPKSKTCVPRTGKKSCDKECGLGSCVDDVCQCINSVSTLHKGTCVLDPQNCASKALTADLSKCNCTGKYKLAKDGLTCELITCADDIAKNDCKAKGATCIMLWNGNPPMYDCDCPAGYIMDEDKGLCTDPCSKFENILECSKQKKVCLNSFSAANDKTGTCGCPPPFITKQGGVCEEITENVYLIKDIPVVKEKYEIQSGIDSVKLNAHLMQAMSKMFNKETFESGYLNNYVVEDNVLKCSVWVRFNEKPKYELERIQFQAQSFPKGACEDCDPELYVWPPSLVLSKKDIDKVKTENLTLCSPILKEKMCGKEAACTNNTCYCPKGYRPIEYTISKGGRILRCEETTGADLDECTLGTHECPQNTNCEKTPGSYICKCKPGFQKDTENDRKDCVDLCTPSPCGQGTCSMKKDKFNCKCQAGYGGSLCDEADVNLAAAKKSTVVVGAVLGTLLIVITLAILFFYIKKRKNFYSEDFMPAPRQDNASEMRERRPMRGVVNTSYE